MVDKQKALAFAGVFLCFVIYIWIVSPGLYGGFVLDDWPNLAPLSNIVTQGFWSVVFEGVSSTLGRPLSLYSFAIQADHWPDNPYPFKLLNLAIHLINSSLVFFVSRLIYSLCFPRSRLVNYFSFCVCVFWLYIPLHASTLFYVVQRMTMLSSLFVLVGMFGWLYGFKLAKGGRSRLGLCVSSTLVGIGYLGGVLSKESAVLLSVFIGLTIILFNFRNLTLSRAWKLWLGVFSAVPFLALVFYLAWDERYLSGYSARHFTPYERVLTELRILWDYLFKIYIPFNDTINIFNDGYPISKGLFNPSTTFAALIGWVAVIAVAIYKFYRWPFFAFGLLWFLGGHLLESSVIGLELYFEHRNYLPSLGLIILLFGSAFQWLERELSSVGPTCSLKQLFIKRYVILLASICTLWLCWFGVVLMGESKSWSSPHEMAMTSLSERPESLRATQEAAAYFANIGDYAQSAMILHYIDSTWPGYPGTRAQQLMLNCYDSNVRLPAEEDIVMLFENGKVDRGAVPALKEVLNIKKSGGCRHLSWVSYRSYLRALFKNNVFSGQRENIIILLAYSYNAVGRFKEAASVLDRYATTYSSIGYRIMQAQFWAMAGDVDKATKIVADIHKRYSAISREWLLHSGKVDALERLLNKKTH